MLRSFNLPEERIFFPFIFKTKDIIVFLFAQVAFFENLTFYEAQPLALQETLSIQQSTANVAQSSLCCIIR